MQPRQVAGNRLAECRQPQILRVERLPIVQRRRRGVADKSRCRLVAFPEPEGIDIGPAHAGIGDLANARGAEVHDGLARQG